MLDDQTILRQRGAEATLHHVATLWKQTMLPTEVTSQLSHMAAKHDIRNVVIIAMDGGAVLAHVAQQLVQPHLAVPVLCCEAAAVPPNRSDRWQAIFLLKKIAQSDSDYGQPR